MAVHQAMILAAGKGTRMRPLTLTTPKPLVMVAGKPLIGWHLERLLAAGVTHVTVNVGYLGEMVSDALAAMHLPLTVRISREPEEPLETAGGIKYALSQGLLADAPFLLINGDVWSDFDLAVLKNHCLDNKKAHLMLVDNPEHNPAGDFALVDGLVCEKMQDKRSYTFAGISLVTPQLVSEVAAGQTQALAPILKAAMAESAVTGSVMPATAKWMDVGTLARLAALEAYLKHKNNQL